MRKKKIVRGQFSHAYIIYSITNSVLLMIALCTCILRCYTLVRQFSHVPIHTCYVQEDGKVGDEFMTEIEPIATQVPYMVSPGNHEWLQ